MSSLFLLVLPNEKTEGIPGYLKYIYTLRNSILKFCNMFWLAGMEGLE